MKTEILESAEEKFQYFLEKGESPYDYEKILIKKHFDRIIEILGGGNPPPYELEIQPTSKCNANCTHCWARNFVRTPDRLGTVDCVNRVVSQVLNFRRNNFEVERVKFCGSTGEPLVNPLTLYAIEQFYQKRYLRLFTNGIKLAENKDNEDYLRTISKLNSLNISLDAGTTETLHRIKRGSAHIALEDILEASAKIKAFSKQDIDITVSYVITKDNYFEIVEATKKSKNFLADRIRARIDLTDRTVSEKHGDTILRELSEAESYKNKSFGVVLIHSENEIKEEDQTYFSSRCAGYKCFTSRLWACIGSDSCLYPCGHIVANGVKNYGSVLEQDLNEVWDSEKRNEIIEELPLTGCSICSPFSLRTNEFMTFLSQFQAEEVEKLCTDVKQSS